MAGPPAYGSNSVYDEYEDEDEEGESEEAVEPCYCDSGCLEVGDCCPDYKDYCGGEYIRHHSER